MNKIPPLCLLQLTFRALEPIRNMHHYHGPMWSALFRDLLRPHLPPGQKLAQSGIFINPIETRLIHIDAGEPINLGIVFPVDQCGAVSAMINEFNSQTIVGGQLRPGITICLDNVTCRISHRKRVPEKSSPRDWETLTADTLRSDIQALARSETFDIVFCTPLRLFRPEGSKTAGHVFCDVPFFLDSKDHGRLALGHLLARLQALENQIVKTDLQIRDGALVFLDNTYGVDRTPMGGATGKLTIQGPPTKQEAFWLILGQFTGVGKNRAFGHGFFQIDGMVTDPQILPLRRAKSLMDRAFSTHSLLQASEKLPDSAPGPDGLTLTDLRKGGEELLSKISYEIHQREFASRGAHTGWLPKKNGGYREISIYSVIDRLVHRAAADFMYPISEAMLSSAAWAYRRGLNRKGAAKALKTAMTRGFNSGIKADIEAFFDTVDPGRLQRTLSALMPFDELPTFIMRLMKPVTKAIGRGLPQGSPLSPVLSNLYLDRFDRELTMQGIRLIRYGDDFVALFRDDGFEDGLQKIAVALQRLNLRLQPEKTTQILRGQSVPFLGYLVSDKHVRSAASSPHEQEQWVPVFNDQWHSGLPVYLTMLCRGAYSSGANLVVNLDDKKEEKIPWKGISRIVIVGRSRVSGGLVYRAARENIPLTYLDIMGRPISQLSPANVMISDLAMVQAARFKDSDLCLNLSRMIVAARIHNNHVLLRRNNLAVKGMPALAAHAMRVANTDVLRGIEGSATRIYFRQLAKLLAPFEFKKRKYHPPDGPVNVMLSFGYTLLRHRIEATLFDHGFDPRLGFYHRSKGRHLALASDLMENLRTLVDRIVVALVRRKEIKPEHFSMAGNAGAVRCRLDGEGFRRFVYRFEHSMARQFTHQGTSMSYNQYLEEMAADLRRTLKMGITYKPLRLK